MKIPNPYTQGTTDYNNFNRYIHSNKKLTINTINQLIESYSARADNTFDYSGSQRSDFLKTIKAFRALLEYKKNKYNFTETKYLTCFSINPFFGEVMPIEDINELYSKVYERTYLLGSLNDCSGHLRPVTDFDECDLVKILRTVSKADNVVLANNIEELKSLSNDPNYHSTIAERLQMA